MIGPYALALFLVEEPRHEAAAWEGLVALAVIQLMMGLLAWRLFRPGGGGGRGSDDDDRGPDGDPPTPPEPAHPVICWPEFERQFADYVAGRARRDAPAERENR